MTGRNNGTPPDVLGFWCPRCPSAPQSIGAGVEAKKSFVHSMFSGGAPIAPVAPVEKRYPGHKGAVRQLFFALKIGVVVQ